MENLNNYLLAELRKLGHSDGETLSVDTMLKAVAQCQRFKMMYGMGTVGVGLLMLGCFYFWEISLFTLACILSMAVAAILLQSLYSRTGKKEFIYKTLLLNRVTNSSRPDGAIKKGTKQKNLGRPSLN